MDAIELSEGAMIEAMSFDDVPFKIVIRSAGAVGCGGSAMVFKGQIVDNAKPWNVAVKVLKDGTDSIQRELLAREWRAAQKVYDSRILLYFAGLVASPYQAIISLYMENGNMLEYLKRNESADRDALIVQVASAVYYLHTSEGLVHGDLKCANVLISDNGDALLGDFGLSTVIEDSNSTGVPGTSGSKSQPRYSSCATLFDSVDPITFEEKTRSGETTASGIRNLYTLRFAAPELLLGSTGGPVRKSRASDVFAFGMLVLEAVTQQAPWAGMNSLAVVQNVCSGELPSRPMENEAISGVSNALWDICLVCWNFEPHGRPTMKRVYDALVIDRPKHSHFVRDENWTEKPNADCGYVQNDKSSTTVLAERVARPADIMTCLVYTPCGRRLVSGSQDHTLRVWDCATGQTVLGPLEGHTAPVYSVAISPDGSQIASSGGDGTIRRWDAHSGAALGRTISRRANNVTCIAYSHDGKFIASGSGKFFGDTIRLWDARTGKYLGKLLHDTGWIGDVAFSADDTRILSISCDFGVDYLGRATMFHFAQENTFRDPGLQRVPPQGRRTRLFKTSSSEFQISRIPPIELAYRPAVAAIALSPSGRRIASAMVDTSIVTWNAETGEPVGSLKSEAGHVVRMLCFSPDEQSIASLTETGIVHFWDLQQVLPQATLSVGVQPLGDRAV